MSEPAAQPMTLEEFLDWAERQEVPYELVDGRPGPKYPEESLGADTLDHHCIQGNVGAILKARKPAGHRAGIGPRIAIDGGRNRIADVAMTCRNHEKGVRLLSDPVLIVEVLSPSTANADKGEKLDDYKMIETVREIWLVDSTRRWVTLLRRVPEGWLLTDHIGSGSFTSEVLGGAVALDELYADTRV
jgi:Uma2 family endonuclease